MADLALKPTNNPVTFKHYRGRLWINKKKNNIKHHKPVSSGDVVHASPPKTSSAAKIFQKTSDPPKNPQPRPEKQAVTHTHRSREWPPWRV
jgi:hypothetical protein